MYISKWYIYITVSDLALSLILSEFSWIVCTPFWRTSAVQLFQVGWLLLMSLNADCISTFFTWIALGIVDFHVCVILVTKANAVKGGGTTSVAWLYRRYQSIHMTDGMTVMSLFATPPTLDKTGHGLCTSHCVKPKSITYLQCQITLHRKLSHRFWKWCKFSSHIKAKLHLKNHIKHDLTAFFNGFSWPFWPHSAIMSEIDHIFYALSCVIICYIKLGVI